MARKSKCTVTLLGFVGNEPTLRYLTDGTPVINVRVLENRVWKDAAGERKEKTLGHDCERFGPYAETLSKLVVKGSYVLIEATINYTDIEGQQYAKAATFRIEELFLLDKPAKREPSEQDSPPA